MPPRHPEHYLRRITRALELSALVDARRLALTTGALEKPVQAQLLALRDDLVADDAGDDTAAPTQDDAIAAAERELAAARDELVAARAALAEEQDRRRAVAGELMTERDQLRAELTSAQNALAELAASPVVMPSPRGAARR